MQKRKLKFKTFFLAIILCGVFGLIKDSQASTYYVRVDGNNSNSGTANSSSEAWRTIQHALEIMVGGDTTYVQAGTYSEDVTTERSGSSGSLITLTAQGTVNTLRFWVNHNYNVINGFHLSGNVAANDAYITITSGGNNCTISNNVIDASGHLDTYAIRHNTKSATNDIISGNTVSNTGSPAFDMGGTGHLVSNNIIHNFHDDVFRSEGCINVTFRGNLAYDGDNSLDHHTDCIQTFGDNGWASYDVVYENNICRDSDAQAWMLTKDAANIHDYTFRNNIWANITDHGQPSMPNFKVYNNIFYRVEKNEQNYAFRLDNVCTGAEVINNIFVDCGDGTIGSYDNTQGSGTFDYSYVARGAANNWDGTVTAPSETHRVLGVSGNIPFTDYVNSDYTPRSTSRGVNMGVVLSSFSVDKLGISRPQGAAWDIGAYEYASGGGDTTPPGAPSGLSVE